ncbi:hypothetical protein [Citrobacter braakii]|uniref:hypothetical protein n=1 Tax=Citrobacter braakii TaxID=57706 RepID=UPI001CC0279E|nr:hypothetical protein [Citrobacter braakii]
MSSREKFEQAIKARFGDLIDYRVCKNSDGEYMAWDMQVAWWAWQASEASTAVQLANTESKCRELAAENGVKQEFIKTCFRAAADGVSMDGDDIQKLGERLGLFGRETYQPVLHGYICGHEAGEDTVYVMKKTPATDSFLAEVQASSRNEGINYAASRLAAAYNHGFIDKPLAEVSDVVRMILDAKDELANATIPPADGLSGEYAEKSLAEFAAQIRKGAAL